MVYKVTRHYFGKLGIYPMEDSHPIEMLYDKCETAEKRAKVFYDIFKAKSRKNHRIIKKLKEGKLGVLESLERYFGSKGRHEYSLFYKTLLKTDEYIPEFCGLLERGVSHQNILESFNANWESFEDGIDGKETVERLFSFTYLLCFYRRENWMAQIMDENEFQQIHILWHNYMNWGKRHYFKRFFLWLPWDVEEEMVTNKQLVKSINLYRENQSLFRTKIYPIPSCNLEKVYRIILKEVDWQLFSFGKGGSLAQRIVKAIKERIEKSKETLFEFNKKGKVNELYVFSFIKGIWKRLKITAIKESPLGLQGIGEAKPVHLEHVLVTPKGKGQP